MQSEHEWESTVFHASVYIPLIVIMRSSMMWKPCKEAINKVIENYTVTDQNFIYAIL